MNGRGAFALGGAAIVAGMIAPSMFAGAGAVTTITTTQSAPTSTAGSKTTAPVSTPSLPATTSPVESEKTVPASTASTSAATPAGIALVDDTNFLTVTVPADWSDQFTAPGLRDDGSERAEITAATNLQQFWDGLTSSGTYVLAVPPTTEPAALLARFSFSNFCTNVGVTPFDDNRFVGLQQTWLDCGGETLRVVNVAARSLDNSFTIFIQVVQPTPDDAELLRVIASAGAAPGAVYPAPTLSAPLTPTGPVPPDLLVAPATPLTTLIDDTGRLSMSVPTSWTGVNAVADMNDNGTDRPRLAAATDVDAFYTDWQVPGAEVIAFPFNNDPSVLLRNLGFAGQCSDGGVQTFNSGTFSGLMQTWTACGGTATRNVQLAISPPDLSVSLFIEVQLPDADNTPLQAVLTSLRVD
jgi:hypothetical protein